MSFFSTPPRDPRSASFSLSTPPSSPPLGHHCSTLPPPPPPPTVASSSYGQPCYATRSFPTQLQAASSRRQCIGMVGRELPRGSRPLRAFTSHDEAPPAATGSLPQPPFLVNHSELQHEGVLSLEEVLAAKEGPKENPKPVMDKPELDDESDDDWSFTSSRFSHSLRSSMWENCAREMLTKKRKKANDEWQRAVRIARRTAEKNEQKRVERELEWEAEAAAARAEEQARKRGKTRAALPEKKPEEPRYIEDAKWNLRGAGLYKDLFPSDMRSPEVTAELEAIRRRGSKILRIPTPKGPGRPRIKTLTREELRAELGAAQTWQDGEPLEWYVMTFKEELRYLKQPVYEEDVIAIFLEGLKSDLRILVNLREDRDKAELLDEIIAGAVYEEQQIGICMTKLQMEDDAPGLDPLDPMIVSDGE